jgi:hypothetical protein
MDQKTVYNSETSKVVGAQLRYVIYALCYLRIYWFTRNPDGFKSSLIMEPGTHRAHIMISPLTEEKEP